MNIQPKRQSAIANLRNWPKPLAITTFVLAFAYFDLYHDTTVHRAGISVRIC